MVRGKVGGEGRGGGGGREGEREGPVAAEDILMKARRGSNIADHGMMYLRKHANTLNPKP